MMSTFSGQIDDAPGLVVPLEKKIMATSCLASLLDSLYLFNVSVCVCACVYSRAAFRVPL